MGTFLDSFMPAITGEIGKLPAAGIQGHVQGMTTARELAMLDQQIKNQQIQQQMLQQQMMLARKPQPMHFAPGAMYGTFDPMTGKQTMTGQVPVMKDPAQEALYRAQEKKALAEAGAYEKFGGMKPSNTITGMIDQKRAMGIPITPEEEQTYNLILRQKGQVPGGVALLDPQTLNLMADQYMAGDTSVFQNLGRGMQGAENIKQLRELIAKKSGQQGVGGPELAARIAELQGVKAGERILGGRMANFGMAMNEAMQMADLVTNASENFPRSNFPLANKAIQAWEKGTGDPAIVQFGAAVNSFINAYARAISPSGVPTVSDKDHAREMLNTAQTKEQVRAVIQQLKQEMEAAGRAPGMVKQELRSSVTGKPGPESSPLLQQSPLYQQTRPKDNQSEDLSSGTKTTLRAYMDAVKTGEMSEKLFLDMAKASAKAENPNIPDEQAAAFAQRLLEKAKVAK